MQDPKPTRFVILHHTQSDGEHWDLMLEQGDVLLTWQLSSDPTRSDSFPIAARRIADHRLAYLTYEGEISGGRGCVSRVAQGVVKFHDESTSHYVFDLSGEGLLGAFSLQRALDSDWTFSLV